ALRAFETAARTLNFTRTAEELGQTQGAISHQIREMEARLGTRLFERQPRGLALTDAGRRYVPYVREAMERLRAGEDALRGPAATAVLTVSVSPNFAAKWLVPRLGRFLADHPEIDLRLSASIQHVDFAREDIDVAIRHGNGDWPHLEVARLCSETVGPMCSPALLPDGRRFASAGDFAGHVLIHDNSRAGWRDWLAARGLPTTQAEHGPIFSQTSLAIDAAVAGQGIVLARSALAALDLVSNRLVRPLPDETPAAFAYWIVAPKSGATRPKVARFRDWLLEQARADERALRNSDAGRNGRLTLT
ncbi:MAG: transcriptional regulator GcvA, partial [Pseudomonadota bacterium]|nr:transcriptional regulator GcvA [Pseudomonadota bacterium]